MTSLRTRRRLVDRIRREGIRDERVLQAIAAIPRHLFVEEALAHRAYEDTALPIGHRQTVSQPYVVALMTQALIADRDVQKVLEIGTGSGYQAAVLAQLVKNVYSLERIAELSKAAREVLFSLRINNVRLRVGDGYQGWEENAPYDGIIVTAAPEFIPPHLIDQLVVGGRLIIPVGDGYVQNLQVVTKTRQGQEEETVAAVKFVPLLGGTVQ